MKKKRFGLLTYLLAGTFSFLPSYTASDQEILPSEQTYSLVSQQNQFRETESKLEAVANNSLIPGTAGHWNPSSKTGQYGSQFSSSYTEFVRQHELLHAISLIDGSSQGEYWADALAAEKTARPEFIRGPFYRPPIK